MTVYSSHFFPTSPAGSGNANVPTSHGKATVGLGLGLPSEVLVTSVHAHPGTGLGIFIDSWLFDDSSESEELASSPAMPSPPLLAVRRSPRKPPADTPGAEAAPMRTPDPSLRGLASVADASAGYFVLALPAASAPTLPSTPALPSGPLEGTGGAGVGLGPGMDLSELDALALASFCRDVAEDAARVPLVGLGLSLQCLDEAELINSFEPQSTSVHGAGLGIDLSFLEDDAASECEDDDSSLPSPWSHPASPMLVSCSVETMHPTPSRAYPGVSFALDGEFDGESQCGPHGLSPRASPDEPTLGFDSPFWATYATVLCEAY
ncbi:hypothetical protein PsYK624_047370 [Phanerochaete sordida]|uniref:Uncharacterized protein n=1 Tax=Phanerochaete sordida TaxID=48140 RepID=A0A9P3G729_9APHY|nr:hypothetical protein PsYK624_047370 [Phanerochaete sordida]